MEDKVHGLGIASMICGIVGLFLFGYILGTLALVLGLVGLGVANTKKGTNIAGITLGIIDIVLLVIIQGMM